MYWEIKRLIVSIMNYENGSNILEIYQALVQIWFATSMTGLDI